MEKFWILVFAVLQLNFFIFVFPCQILHGIISATSIMLWEISDVLLRSLFLPIFLLSSIAPSNPKGKSNNKMQLIASRRQQPDVVVISLLSACWI